MIELYIFYLYFKLLNSKQWSIIIELYTFFYL